MHAAAGDGGCRERFPPVDRVLYVNECMRANPGPHFEMINKCSCALDRLASEVKFDDYVSMTTIVNAVSIGGERGGEMRDNETLKPQIARLSRIAGPVRPRPASSGRGNPPMASVWRSSVGHRTHSGQASCRASLGGAR